MMDWADWSEELVARWNRAVGVGDPIHYYAHATGGTPLPYVTRSEAYLVGGHTAVVFLEGVIGYVAVCHCMPVTRKEPCKETP